MNLSLFRQILDQAGEHLYRIQFYDQGEPFINKQLLEMISLAAKHDIGSQVSTNFSFGFADTFYRSIVESGLEHIIIAMDGVNAATYSPYRVNGRFELVEAGMRQVIKWKRRLKRRLPFVEWQFIIFDHNRHSINEAKVMARDIGVDRLCFKYDAGAAQDEWRRIDQFKDRTVRRVRLNSCLWLWGSLNVGTDGTVRPCCNAGRNELIGDLKVTPLRELWNSERMKSLRACVREGGREASGTFMTKSPCTGCPHIM